MPKLIALAWRRNSASTLSGLIWFNFRRGRAGGYRAVPESRDHFLSSDMWAAGAIRSANI